MFNWNDQGQCLYSTDEIMLDIQRRLERELYVASGIRYNSSTVEQLRTAVFHSPWGLKDPGLVKLYIQVRDFCKRYRFKAEPLSQAELVQVTLDKYHQVCKSLGPLPDTSLIRSVTRLAKQYATEILGEYTESEHFQRCKFGTRAVVGSSLADSYLHLKLCVNPVTGTIDQHLLFSRYLETDPILREIWESGKSALGTLVDTLKLSLVPKSFKIMRPIVPNTLLGNFFTAGLQGMIAHRLKVCGLDIRRLQEVHRKLAHRFSLSRTHVTADLSAASDTITRDLVEALLPKDWFEALDLHHIGKVQIPGNVSGKPVIFQTRTFAGMGIGYTFPLETLVFYVLLKAIKELSGCTTGFCSVYGDDLIYPRAMHRYVRVIFPLLGFTLNEDKTYAEEYFRESCGADFYRGVDVRPYHPMAEHRSVDWRGISAYLYKLINGLKEHWDYHEIPSVFNRLYQWLTMVSNVVYLVPPSESAGAGLHYRIGERLNWLSQNNTIKFPEYVCNESTRYTLLREKWAFRGYRYRRLVEKPLMVRVPRRFQIAYYWDALRSSSTVDEDVRTSIINRIEQTLHIPFDERSDRWEQSRTRRLTHFEESTPSLVWRIRHGRDGEYLAAHVPAKQATVHLLETANAHSWR